MSVRHNSTNDYEIVRQDFFCVQIYDLPFVCEFWCGICYYVYIIGMRFMLLSNFVEDVVDYFLINRFYEWSIHKVVSYA